MSTYVREKVLCIPIVEFCWYNGCEAPDYYDDTKDSFYEKI